MVSFGGVILLIALSSGAASATSTVAKVRVDFFGESKCPFCQRFVNSELPTVVDDPELSPYLDFDFFPWGNAYFATDVCGRGPDYDSTERQCWASKCAATPEPDFCFASLQPIYQHGPDEGRMDTFQGCAKKLARGPSSSSDALAFLRCAEKAMAGTADAVDTIARRCADSIAGLSFPDLESCVAENERDRGVEIENARATPPHPGVPWVLVDGKPLEGPLKTAVCRVVAERYGTKLPTCDGVEGEGEYGGGEYGGIEDARLVYQ